MPAKKSSSAKEKKVLASLKAASRLLNKNWHKPLTTKGLPVRGALTVYQVWCNDQEIVIAPPTTDKTAAYTIKEDHEERTGHICRVLVG